MIFTPLQIWTIIGVITMGTMITRFLPFIVFPDKKEPPKIVSHLSDCLPPAMMGLLVVYCLKSTEIKAPAFALPELISIVLIVILHKWKNNVLLSILGGTAVYIILLHFLVH